MFPFKIEKARYIPGDGTSVFAEKIREEILRRIETAGFTVLSISAEKYSFSAPWFRYIWRRWSFLNQLSSGTLEINELKDGDIVLNYKLRFTEFLIYAFVFSLIPGFFYFVGEVLVSGIFIIWGLFYVGSVMLGTVGFGNMIARAYKQVVKAK